MNTTDQRGGPMSDASIDRATFAELQDTAGADFVKELVQTFLEEAPAMPTPSGERPIRSSPTARPSAPWASRRRRVHWSTAGWPRCKVV